MEMALGGRMSVRALYGKAAAAGRRIVRAQRNIGVDLAAASNGNPLVIWRKYWNSMGRGG
jgi:hypothetical protein